jgi:CHAT domain-containing protein
VLVNLFERRQLDSLLHSKKSSQGEHRLNTLYSPDNNALYKLIWQPIEKELKGINKVYFAPMDLLEKISFAALPVDSNHLLSDNYHLVQVTSTSSILDPETAILLPNTTMTLFGGVQYDADSISMSNAVSRYSAVDSTSGLPVELLRGGAGEFNYLTQSENEVQSIGDLALKKNYSVTIAKGINANEESFKALTGKHSPNILHLATHGFFFPDPQKMEKTNQPEGVGVFQESDNPLMRAGLALAGANNAWKGKPLKGVEDGILTAYEVSNMYLPNTHLVVLSACETGLGDDQGPEGVYGLQRAFKMAGAKNLLMSLWKVDDLSTSEFMQEFYKDLFSTGAIQQSFEQAQNMMKNKYRNQPFKWAAWILVR